MMEELPDYVKKARMTLSANGSRFVTYDQFLCDYEKDHKMNFENDAWNDNWINGREVVEYYEDIFDFNGREIRRIFTDENAHIARAIDGSKKSRKPAPKRGSGAPRGRYSANTLRKPYYQNDNSYMNGNKSYNSSRAPFSHNYQNQSRAQPSCSEYQNQSRAQSSFSEYQNQSRTSYQNQSRTSSKASFNGQYSNGYATSANRVPVREVSPKVPPGFAPKTTASTPSLKVPPGFELKTTARIPSPVKDDVSSVTSQMASISVSPDWYKDTTYLKISEDVADNVFKMFMEIYNQGLNNVLKPDTLLSVIKENKLDSHFSLNKLKSFLFLCFPDSFHIVTEDTNSFSIKSKSVQPRSGFSILVKLPKRNIKKDRLSGNVKCEIINAEIADNLHFRISLRSFAWKDDYTKLIDELRRYAQLIGCLEPIDMIFKQDNLLYFDSVSCSFYRCMVISHVEGDRLDIFLIDEFKTRTVTRNWLYSMPLRFYKYNQMSFSLITDRESNYSLEQFKEFAIKKSSAKVSIERSTSDKLNQVSYSGKITVNK